MVSLEIIEREINELEYKRDTTYNVCERLAWLYVVRDHLMPSVTTGDERTPNIQGSEFLEACSGIGHTALMGILDEHMEALRVVHPREYESLMSKILALKS